MNQAGYSGTPLAKKLGIREGFTIKLVNQPDYYFKLFLDFPTGVKIIADRKVKKDFIHYFTSSAFQLEKDIKLLRQEIVANGMIWISWPKKPAAHNDNGLSHQEHKKATDQSQYQKDNSRIQNLCFERTILAHHFMHKYFNQGIIICSDQGISGCVFFF